MRTSVHIGDSVTRHVDWSEAISGNRLDGIVHGRHVESLRTRPVCVIIFAATRSSLLFIRLHSPCPSCGLHPHVVSACSHRVSRPRVPTWWAASASSRFAQGSPFAHSDQRLCRASGMTDCASMSLHVIRCSCQRLIGAYVPHPPRRLHDRYDRCRRNAEHCNIQSIRIYELVD